MIDAHVHLGGIPNSGKNWGNFEEYKKIADEIEEFIKLVDDLRLKGEL